MAQGVGLLMLMFSVVFGYLAFSRVSTLETAMEAIWTDGAMNTLVNSTSFFFILLVGVVVLGFIAASIAYLLNLLK